MNEKNSFVLYTSYLDQVDLLSDEQAGVLLKSILRYAAGAEPAQMDGMTAMAFSFIKAGIDKDTDKYKKTCEARREAGRMGGRPPKCEGEEEKQTKAKKANGFYEKQTKAKKADNDNEYDSDNDLKKKDTDVSKEKASRFLPPTLDEVRGYCLEKGYPVDAERFIDFYESKGWFVGKNKMKDWKAAVRNWNRMQREDGAAKASGQRQADSAKGKNRFNNFEQRQNDYGNMVWDEIRRRANEGST